MSGWQSVAAYCKLWFWCIAFYPLAQRPSSYIEMDSNYANFMESYYIFNFSNFPTRVVNDFVHFNMGEFTRNFSQVGNLNAASNYLFGIEFMTAIKLMVFFFLWSVNLLSIIRRDDNLQNSFPSFTFNSINLELLMVWKIIRTDFRLIGKINLMQTKHPFD